MNGETVDRALEVGIWVVTAVAGIGLVYWIFFMLL